MDYPLQVWHRRLAGAATGETPVPQWVKVSAFLLSCTTRQMGCPKRGRFKSVAFSGAVRKWLTENGINHQMLFGLGDKVRVH